MAKGNIAGAVAAGVLRAEKQKGRYKMYKKMKVAYRKDLRNKRFMRNGGAFIKLKPGDSTSALTPEQRLEAFGPTWKTASALQRTSRKLSGYMGHGLYQGQGGYWGAAKKYGGMALRAALPYAKHAAIQAAEGYFGGAGLYSGSGSYSESNNLIEGSSAAVPTMQSSRDETGSTIVTHREYIQDIYAPGTQGGGAVNFSNISYPLNPGLQSSFPWLSQIAQNYDEYEFMQLIYTYKSTTTDIGSSTTGQCGTVIMCTNYNAASPKFFDKQQMIEYAHSASAKVTCDLLHGVECDKSKIALTGCLYTRANPVITGQDLKTYDHGLFQLAIANTPTAYNGYPVGELWVDYTVRLSKPKLFVSRGLEIDMDQFLWDKNSLSTYGALFNGAYLSGQQNNIGCLITQQNGGNQIQITFPAQYTGPLSVRIFGKTQAAWPTALTSYSLAPALVSTTGNITYINDIYTGNFGAAETAEPTYLITVPSETETVTNINSTICFYGEYHIFTSLATQGLNNSITINNATGGTLPTATAFEVTLQIQQYQSNNMPFQSTLLQWVNSSGTVTLPNA